MKTSLTTTTTIYVRREGRLVALLSGAPVALVGDWNGSGATTEYLVETPDGFQGWAYGQALEVIGAFGIRRSRETGEWMVVDREGEEVGPRLPEALTSTQALAIMAR